MAKKMCPQKYILKAYYVIPFLDREKPTYDGFFSSIRLSSYWHTNSGFYLHSSSEGCVWALEDQLLQTSVGVATMEDEGIWKEVFTSCWPQELIGVSKLEIMW